MPKPTFKQCLKKKGFLSKLDLLFRYYTGELFLIILAISFLLSTLSYNLVMKDKFIYPNQEFEYLERFVEEHSNKIYEIIQNPDMLKDFEYEISFTKDIIKTKYTIPVSVGCSLIESVYIIVEQDPVSLEIISMNREIGEKGFYNLMFVDYVVLSSLIITIVIAFVILVVCFIMEIINASKVKSR